MQSKNILNSIQKRIELWIKYQTKNKGIAWWVIQTSINIPPATNAEIKKNWQYVNAKYKAANIKNTVKEYTKPWSAR